jgi:hypothetical protein
MKRLATNVLVLLTLSTTVHRIDPHSPTGAPVLSVAEYS